MKDKSNDTLSDIEIINRIKSADSSKHFEIL